MVILSSFIHLFLIVSSSSSIRSAIDGNIDGLCEGEVVGFTGRIGSFLLRANPNCVPVSKDVRPGTLSPIDTPIYVSVPATQVKTGMCTLGT